MEATTTKAREKKQNEITIANASLACISVNYGECVQLIILFLYHLSTPEKKAVR